MRPLRLLGFVLVAVLVTSCAEAGDDSSVASDESALSSVPFQPVADDPGELAATPTKQLFTSAAAYKAAFGHDAPGVDFTREWVVFFAAGTQPSGGYRASVRRIDTAVFGLLLSVQTGLDSPGPDCIPAPGDSRPYALVKFRRPTPRPVLVAFSSRDGVVDCSLELDLLAGGLGGPGTIDGQGAAARFDHHGGLACDGTTLYIASGDRRVRKMDLATASVTTLATLPIVPIALPPDDFAFPPSVVDVALDGIGGLWVADAGNCTVQRVDVASGAVALVAGTPFVCDGIDGVGTAGHFHGLHGLAADATTVYVSEDTSIRAITIATGEVTTIAGGPNNDGAGDGIGSAASFSGVHGIALDGNGHLYAADFNNHLLRRIDLSTHAVTTVAGSEFDNDSDGVGTHAGLFYPIALTRSGGKLFIGEYYGARVRSFDLATATVTTVFEPSSGDRDGSLAQAEAFGLRGLTSNASGQLFFSDTLTVRKLDLGAGMVTTLAGQAMHWGATDAVGANARFFQPTDVVADEHTAYVTDSSNGSVRAIALDTGATTTIASGLGYPMGIGVEAGSIYIGDIGFLYAIDPVTHAMTTIAGGADAWPPQDGVGAGASFVAIQAIVGDGEGTLYVGDGPLIRKVTVATGEVTTIAGSYDDVSETALYNVTGLALAGTKLYIAGGSRTVKVLDLTTNVLTTIAGATDLSSGFADGVGSAARFDSLGALALDGAGRLYAMDGGNHALRVIDVNSHEVTTLFGEPMSIGVRTGPLASATLAYPHGLALTTTGTLLLTDVGENAVLQIH